MQNNHNYPMQLDPHAFFQIRKKAIRKIKNHSFLSFKKILTDFDEKKSLPPNCSLSTESTIDPDAELDHSKKDEPCPKINVVNLNSLFKEKEGPFTQKIGRVTICRQKFGRADSILKENKILKRLEDTKIDYNVAKNIISSLSQSSLSSANSSFEKDLNSSNEINARLNYLTNNYKEVVKINKSLREENYEFASKIQKLQKELREKHRKIIELEAALQERDIQDDFIQNEKEIMRDMYHTHHSLKQELKRAKEKNFWLNKSYEEVLNDNLEKSSRESSLPAMQVEKNEFLIEENTGILNEAKKYLSDDEFNSI